VNAQLPQRDRAILDAALSLFYERGYGAVSVDEIGQRAGLSGPSIYRHFRSKHEILSTLFDEAMDRALQLIGPIRDDPNDEVRALIRAQTTFARTDRELLAVYAREIPALTEDARQRLRRRQRHYADRWVSAMQRCFPERDPKVVVSTAHMMMTLLLSSSEWPREVLAGDQLANLLEALVWQGLGGISPEFHADGRHPVPRVARSAPWPTPGD
jgi:AcrR family transcriptional regulator